MRAQYWLSALVLTVPLFAEAANHDESGARKIELKDGSTIVIQVDGTMRHFDSKGKPMKMAPGKSMEAKDGSVYEMRNDALWQRLWLRGTLKEPR